MRGAPEEKKPQKMVRSSIACSRCRRSKVKCVNTGVTSTCKACEQSHRECVYPTAGSSTPATKRPEAPVGIKVEGDTGESKKRVRKIEDIGRRNSQKPGEDVLESPLLTKKVWNEVYEIFKLHFSTELPFLHPPTFRALTRMAAFPRESPNDAAEIEKSRVVLLGVLTLAARFHPVLVAHHSPSHDDPLAASEYYATSLAAALGPTIRTISKPSLANIQALLMIGLYDWGQSRGLSAWLYVGLAIRLALPTGLAVEDDPNKLVSHDSGQSSLESRKDAIETEVRRRTLWSCFIMDRMLSAGKQRPTMIDVDMLRVQLPCSDDQFLFVHDVRTAFLKPLRKKDGTQIPRELTSGNNEGVLSKYVRLVDIFGQLSTWSYAGGRRAPEELPPWEPKSNFSELRNKLNDFEKSLPESLKYTEENLSAHIEKRNATAYASLHMLFCLCLIVLHREYIPHIPIRCASPEGPLDPPIFSPETYGDQIPEGFWLDSAETLMKASRDIIVIAQTCQENNALPESPQIGFGVWQAAFVSLYAGWFPHMDTSKHLVSPGHSVPPDRRSGRIGQTWRLLKDMSPRIKMVNGHIAHFESMENFYREAHRTFAKSYPGGGLEHYKTVEKDLKEFGELKDADQASDIVDQVRSRASTNEVSASVNGEPMTGVEPARQTWAAVNHGLPAGKTSSPPVEVDIKPQFPSQHPYGVPVHSPNQSNAPSLMSAGHASNGDTTPGNSPYMSIQYPPTQPIHAGNFASVSAHSMAPPQYTEEMPTVSNLDYRAYENMAMPPTLDGFVQDASMGGWGTNGVIVNYEYPWTPYYSKEQQVIPLGMQ